jgi:hypothetical protein
MTASPPVEICVWLKCARSKYNASRNDRRLFMLLIASRYGAGWSLAHRILGAFTDAITPNKKGRSRLKPRSPEARNWSAENAMKASILFGTHRDWQPGNFSLTL